MNVTEDFDQLPLEFLGGVPGLAGESDIIRLAQLTGMQPEVELPMMPWLSRVPLISSEPARDTWKSMNP